MHLEKVYILSENFPDKNVYPFKLKVFHKTECIPFKTPVTFFTGENGTGKSTLLEAIANKCRIHIWGNDERKRFENNPYEREFYKYIKIEWTKDIVPGSYFASEIFKNFAQILDDWAANDPDILDFFGGKSLLTQSHGQSLMSFFKSRFKIKGLYILDEPETALSPKRQIELLELLNSIGKSGYAQFIVATHSPILLACPGAVIYNFDSAPIKKIEYKKTSNYKIYKSFMVDPSKYLGKL